jgi:isochorismate hydrolase
MRPIPAPNPERSALLVVDAQIHFRGMLEPVLSNIQSVLTHFRQHGRPVVFTRHRHQDPATDAGMMAEWWGDLLIDGEADAELIPDLQPEQGERLIEKCRYSAFLNTSLEEDFRRLGVENVIVSGVMTNLCCETTARDAFMRDFRVYFLLDGTATCTEEYHLATLKNLSYGFAYVVTCSELLALL